MKETSEARENIFRRAAKAVTAAFRGQKSNQENFSVCPLLLPAAFGAVTMAITGAPGFALMGLAAYSAYGMIYYNSKYHTVPAYKEKFSYDSKRKTCVHNVSYTSSFYFICASLILSGMMMGVGVMGAFVLGGEAVSNRKALDEAMQDKILAGNKLASKDGWFYDPFFGKQRRYEAWAIEEDRCQGGRAVLVRSKDGSKKGFYLEKEPNGASHWVPNPVSDFASGKPTP